MKQIIATLPQKRISKFGSKKNPTYYIVIPKPLIDANTMNLEDFYDFDISLSDVITEGVIEAKKRIRSEKKCQL